MEKSEVYQIIRAEALNVAKRLSRQQPYRLSGRGHEPRVSLDRKMAAALRGCDLPRVVIAGYGANNFYPRRVFVAAQATLSRKLGWKPFEISSDSTVYLLEPPTGDSQRQDPA